MRRQGAIALAQILALTFAGSVAANPVAHPVKGLAGALEVPAVGADQKNIHETLSYVYEHHREMLKARAELRAADEAVNQAWAGWRPTVKATGSHSVEKKSFSERLSASDGITPMTTGSLSLQQRLLDFGATNAGINAAEAERAAKRSDYQSKTQDILLRAAQAHIEMIRDRNSLNIARDRRAGISRIRDKTTTEYKVGLTNRAAVALAESNLEGAMARIATAEGQLEKSRAAFLFAVGYMPGDLEFPNSLAQLIPGDLKELERIALTHNPAIIASERRLAAARAAINNARGGAQPTLDAQGSAARSMTGRDTGRYGVDTSSIQVSLTIPLYNPPSYSQIRQSQESALAARMALELARLQVTQGVASAWASMVSARSEIRQLEAQIKATEETLRGNREERELGTMSVFEVLNTEQQLYDQQQQLNNARSSSALAEYQLLSLMGRLVPETLGLKVASYDPDENYEDVRTAWFGTKDEEAMGLYLEDELPKPEAPEQSMEDKPEAVAEPVADKTEEAPAPEAPAVPEAVPAQEHLSEPKQPVVEPQPAVDMDLPKPVSVVAPTMEAVPAPMPAPKAPEQPVQQPPISSPFMKQSALHSIGTQQPKA